MATLKVELFYQRLDKLLSYWTTNRSVWYDSDVICIPNGKSDDVTYSKSSAFHLYLFGFEFPESIIIMTKNEFAFMATPKKCSMLEPLIGKSDKLAITLLHKEKDNSINQERFRQLLAIAKKGGGKKIGSFFKAKLQGEFIADWMNILRESPFETTEIQSSVGLYLSVKDQVEQDLCKKSAILSNRVLKHSFVQEMSVLLDEGKTISHEDFSEKLSNVISDPSQIGLKIPSDVSEICYTPIIQSGGKYDVKPSAQSNGENLAGDIILCSLGARYHGYCSNISRTFIMDGPKKVEDTYNLLLRLYTKCLEAMVDGNELGAVAAACKAFIAKTSPELAPHLPTSFGFSTGLEFRDPTLVLNDSNKNMFRPGMVFVLSVSFHNVPLARNEIPSSYNGMETFSLLLSDTVLIQSSGAPEVLTRYSNDYGEISYSLNAEEGEQAENNEEEEGGEEEEARVSERSSSRNVRTTEVESDRASKQHSNILKALEEGKRRRKLGDGLLGKAGESQEIVEFKDTYNSQEEFPRESYRNQIRIDPNNEALLVPIGGHSVPFHVSTIKSISLPDPDRATFMRINFYIPGTSIGKEAAKAMQHLLLSQGGKFPFIKEMTFKSSNSRNLSEVNTAFIALRKRMRERMRQEEIMKDVVEQTKLIKLKDQRIPRLQDVTMKPHLNRKTVGVIEAHQNGLRFVSTKGETIDVMYQNIKHTIFQPCEAGSPVVLLHFHLKNPIATATKKLTDIQFFTEVIESSISLEGFRSSGRDREEIEDEQREREIKKRLNKAFHGFGLNLEAIANRGNFPLSIEVPLKKEMVSKGGREIGRVTRSFQGTCGKEMLTFYITPHCLISVTETPPFIITLSEVEHIHFERLSFGTRGFDLIFIFKDWSVPHRSIMSIDIKYKDEIQDWITYLLQIPFTFGAKSMNWPMMYQLARDDGDYFYLDHNKAGKKPPGWMFLGEGGAYQSDDDSEEGGEDGDEDSEFDSDAASSDESSEDSEDSDDSFSDEDDDGSEEEEEDEEEEGEDWDQLEKKAQEEDRKRAREEEMREDREKESKKPKGKR